ncbi:MAG: hypothetical protein LW878_13070 [Proteobacteria bacterium]|nr:hypothetical protein [Pseudomonadota bacterium]
MKTNLLFLLMLSALPLHAQTSLKLPSSRLKVKVETVVGHKRVVVGRRVAMPANEAVAAQALTMVNQGEFLCDVKIDQFHHNSADGFNMLYGLENCEKY